MIVIDERFDMYPRVTVGAQGLPVVRHEFVIPGLGIIGAVFEEEEIDREFLGVLAVLRLRTAARVVQILHLLGPVRLAITQLIALANRKLDQGYRQLDEQLLCLAKG